MSSMVWISWAGMTPRMVSSTRAMRFSVSSMRVPGGPRTWSFRSPASTEGKKSRPTRGKRARGGAPGPPGGGGGKDAPGGGERGGGGAEKKKKNPPGKEPAPLEREGEV